ncbi:MAG: hypothetical protein ABI536_07290 [Gallionella sp.]
MRDLLAGHDDIADQAGEFPRGTWDCALFFDDELNQTLTHAFYFLIIKNFTARDFTAFPPCPLWLFKVLAQGWRYGASYNYDARQFSNRSSVKITAQEKYLNTPRGMSYSAREIALLKATLA